jgi:hypothetical protein
VETGVFVLYTMVGIADCEMSSKIVVHRAKAENVQVLPMMGLKIDEARRVVANVA